MNEHKTKKDIIKEIKGLCSNKLGKKKGVIMDSYESMEVGIRTYNYYVISQEGLYVGYWTDPKPRLADRTIISRIIESEECQGWDSLDDKMLREILSFLMQY